MQDVTIIGAGPAGSVAAVALAARGHDVTLIEQHRFPRDKVCGESLSALGLSVLDRLHLLDSLRPLHPAVLTATTLHAPDGRTLYTPLPQPMWGLSRRALDAALLDAATAHPNVRLLQPARCESLAPTLTIRHLDTNRCETLRPTWTLLADGKGALLPDRPRPTRDLGIKAHFTHVASPRDAVALYGVHGHYVGAGPIEDDRTNVAFSLPTARLRERCAGNLDALWSQLLTENTTLARRFAGATRVGDWLAAPLPRFGVRRDWPDRVIPLGNAAAALEPIGGEGMGLALRSAELAADALDRGLPIDRLRRQFDHLWRTRRLACRSLARLLSSPAIAGDAIDLVQDNAPLSRAALRLIGKG